MNTCLTGGSVDDGVLLVVVEPPPPEPWLFDDEGEVTVCAVWAGTVTVTVPPPEPPPPEEADDGGTPAFELAWLVGVLDSETDTSSGPPVALWATEPTDEPIRAPNASKPITATAAARGCNDESRSSQSRAGVQGVSSRSRRAPTGTPVGMPVAAGAAFSLSSSATAAGRVPRRAPHSTQ